MWLNVTKSELQRRLTKRENHYMKPEMLDSQIATFEPVNPEENVITVDGLLSPSEIVNELLNQAKRLFPSMNKEWWQR